MDVEAYRKVDAERRAALSESEQLKAQKNAASQEVGKLKKAGQDTSEQQQKIREIGDHIAELDEKANGLDDAYRLLMPMRCRTLPHESVPTGKSAADNVEIKRWGTPPSFSFTPKAHWDIGPDLGILDFERAAKITGARFAVYMKPGAKKQTGADRFCAGRFIHTAGARLSPKFLHHVHG